LNPQDALKQTKARTPNHVISGSYVGISGRFCHNSWYQVPFPNGVTLKKGHTYKLSCTSKSSQMLHCIPDEDIDAYYDGVKQVGSVLTFVKHFGKQKGGSFVHPKGLISPFRGIRFTILE
jgi:hypothetical protein